MVTRDSLPQNYVLSEGTTLKSFNNAADWSKSGGSSTIEVDSSTYSTSCLKFNALAGGSSSMFDCAINNTFPENEGNDFYLRFTCHSPKADVNSFRIYIGNSTLSKYFTFNLGVNWLGDGQDMYLSLPRYKFDAAYGGARWDDAFTKLRVLINPQTGKTVSMTFKDIVVGRKTIPTNIIRFDDGRKSIINIAFPYMEARGIKGTVYINSSRIGTTGYMTLADLVTLKNAGWAICNHTHTHPHLEALTLQEIIDEFQTTIDYIVDNELNVDDSAYHVAYPYGDVYNSTIATAMQQLGIKTGILATWLYQLPHPDFLLKMHNNGINSSLSLTTFKQMIARSQNIGGVGIYLFHNIVSTVADSAYDVQDTVFYGIIDFLVAENAKVQTITQWDKARTNPRLI